MALSRVDDTGKTSHIETNSVHPAGKMRALRVNTNSTTASLELVDMPNIGSTDVLIKVNSAILAPDVFGLVEAGRLSYTPTTLGHKVAGTIAQIGDAVTAPGMQVGARVRLDPNLSCGSCVSCLTDRDQMCAQGAIMGFFGLAKSDRFERNHEGGTADYVRAPQSQVELLPDGVSFELGAKVHDLANCVRVLKVAGLPPIGSTVLITAATGAMGTATARLAKSFGVSRLILVGRSTERLEAVKDVVVGIDCQCIGLDTLGEDWVSAKALAGRVKVLAPEGVDAVIDYSPNGAEAMWQVIYGLAPHGTFVHVGGNWSILPVPMRVIGLNCWRIVGTRNHSRSDSKTVMKLLQDGLLNEDKKVMTHHFTLEDVGKAIAQLKDRSQQTWNIVIHP